MTDTEIEHALNFATVEGLLTFKAAYGEHWRKIALLLIQIEQTRKKLDAIHTRPLANR